MFTSTEAHPLDCSVDQLGGRSGPTRLSIAEVTCLIEQFLESAATRPAGACPVRLSLIDAIADFDAGWDVYSAMTAWLMQASRDIEHSDGGTRLTQRRAYRCAEEAFALTIELLELDTAGRQPLDTSCLRPFTRIDNQAAALKAHKALKRLERTQSVAGWHAFVVEAAQACIGRARLAHLAGAAATNLGQIVRIAAAVGISPDRKAVQLRRRLVELERELASMSLDAIEQLPVAA